MREMKDSGIEWIGEIPSGWSLKKIKYCLKERIEKNNPVKTFDILSLTAKQGVIPYEQKEGGGNKPKEDISEYRLAYPGDIVMNSMNILSGSVGLSEYLGCVSPVYYMLRPINKMEDVRFYNYIFQTTVFQRSLFGLGNGILIKESGNGKLNTIRMRIPMDKFGQLFIPVAPDEEEQQIADYLDSKCAEIDTLTSDIETQIETLEQYKRSVITEAVTKGLDPGAEMKDSGVEYIGDFPSDWDLVKLKYVLNERNERSDNGTEMLLSVSQTKGVIPSNLLGKQTMQAGSLIGYKKVFVGDLVFNKLNPGLARFGCSSFEGITSPDFSVYIVNKNCGSQFLQYLLKTDKYVAQFKGVGVGVGDGFARLYSSQLYQFYVAMPQQREINSIVNYLDQKCSDIDEVIAKKQAQIETLSEYKKSIIYEYVTGKKEIPSANEPNG